MEYLVPIMSASFTTCSLFQYFGAKPLSSVVEIQIAATRRKYYTPDLLIQPKLGHLHFLEFRRAEPAIAEGYKETKACIEFI